MTEVQFDQLDKIKLGVDKIANAVKSTLGPGGQGVVISKRGSFPVVTKDGVTVAHNIFLEDPVENIGAMLVKEVANKTVDGAGDGTTTATVLSQAIFGLGLKAIKAGVNPIDLKAGIDAAVAVVVECLKKQSEVVKGKEKIAQVANISTNNDMEISKMIAESIDQIGENGFISADDSNSTETHVKITKGMQLERGFLSPFFITNPERQLCEFDDPYILITDKRITTVHDILPALEKTAQQGKSLLIIAEEIEGEALATLVINKRKGAISVCAIRAPFGQKNLLLEDIAILTGGRVMSEEHGFSLAKVQLEDLGRCNKLTVSPHNTVIIGGKGDEEKIKARIKQLQNESTTTPDEKEALRIKTRLAKLDGGVAIIYVGGYTEIEVKEKKYRVEDAIFATIAAVEEGIVPGGGIALMNCLSELERQLDAGPRGWFFTRSGKKEGIQIIYDAIQVPLKTLAENSAVKYKDVIRTIRLNSEDTDNFGWDARKNEFGNMMDLGVVDPTKVVRLAVENAASVMGLLLSTKALVFDKPEPRLQN